MQIKFADAVAANHWEKGGALTNYEFCPQLGSGAAFFRKILAPILKRKQPNEKVKILDVGCADASLFEGVVQVMKKIGVSEEQIYLRGVTASMEEGGSCVRWQDEEESDNTGAIKVYGDFELEKISELRPDFIREGVKFDLIVASWTMLHLVDSLGTLVQLWDLLDPNGGQFVGNQFCAHVDVHELKFQDPAGRANFLNFVERVRNMGYSIEYYPGDRTMMLDPAEDDLVEMEPTANDGFDTVRMARNNEEGLKIPAKYDEENPVIDHSWCVRQTQYMPARYISL